MRAATAVRIILIFSILIISFSADARRKKKNKNKAPATKAASVNLVSKTDSTKNVATISRPSVTPVTSNAATVKKQEEIKPFAQLVVSFTSMGGGINAKARDQFLEHIQWFNTQNHCELMYDKKPWGREGEIDYCFFGNNQILIPTLYKQLKEKFTGIRQIFIKENFPCK